METLSVGLSDGQRENSIPSHKHSLRGYNMYQKIKMEAWSLSFVTRKHLWGLGQAGLKFQTTGTRGIILLSPLSPKVLDQIIGLQGL